MALKIRGKYLKNWRIIPIFVVLFRNRIRSAGCSAARLARHVRDVEVASSNLATPTTRKPLLMQEGVFFMPARLARPASGGKVAPRIASEEKYPYGFLQIGEEFYKQKALG